MLLVQNRTKLAFEIVEMKLEVIDEGPVMYHPLDSGRLMLGIRAFGSSSSEWTDMAVANSSGMCR